MVDVLTPGNYELTYSVTDSDNQTTIAHRMITVYPKEILINYPPVIKAQNRIIKKGSSFDLLEGVTAYDAEDGDLTSNIEVIYSTVNIDQVGVYEVIYQVSDQQGAISTLAIEINVREIPETGLALFH